MSWKDIELINCLGQGNLKAKTDEEAIEEAKKLLGNWIFISVIEGNNRFVDSFWNKKKLHDKINEISD